MRTIIIFFISITTCFAQKPELVEVINRWPNRVDINVTDGLVHKRLVSETSDTAFYFHANGKEYIATTTFKEIVTNPPVWTKVDHTASGTWRKSTKTGSYNNTITWSCLTGNSFEYQFEGAGIRWIVEQLSTHGKAKIEIDGVSEGEVNTFNSTLLQQQQVFERVRLTNELHTFKATILNNCIVSDAFEVLK